MKNYMKQQLRCSLLISIIALFAFSTRDVLSNVEKNASSATKKPITIAIVNVLEGKDKKWVVHPAEVPSGQAYKITVVNTMNEPHGLAIDGFIPETVILPDEVRTFEIPADKTGKAGEKKIRCHMHPAHVGTKILLK